MPGMRRSTAAVILADVGFQQPTPAAATEGLGSPGVGCA